MFFEINKWANEKKEAIERGFYLIDDCKAILAREGDRIRLRKAVVKGCSDTLEEVLKQRIRIAVNSSLTSFDHSLP
jgi:uncharacterized Zn ribbon protein